MDWNFVDGEFLKKWKEVSGIFGKKFNEIRGRLRVNIEKKFANIWETFANTLNEFY